jgi:hypothetical protein
LINQHGQDKIPKRIQRRETPQGAIKGKGNSLSIIKNDKKPKLTNAQRTTVTVAAAGVASAASVRAKEALNFVMSRPKKREPRMIGP